MSDPCSLTKACNAFRCSAAQLAASPVGSTRKIGGLPGCSSTLGSEVRDEYVTSVDHAIGSRGVVAKQGHWSCWDAPHPLEPALDQFRQIGKDRVCC